MKSRTLKVKQLSLALRMLSDDDDDIEAERSSGLIKLCVTRWTVRATAFKRVMDNYEALYKLWDDCLEGNLD